MQVKTCISPQLKQAQKRFVAELRISKRGVPHLVLKRSDTVYSICWFGTTKIFRLFWPYPSFCEVQHKRSFNDLDQLETFLNGVLTLESHA